MTENRARTAVDKIEFFQKAANDTPQRAVAEVWAIAKDVKAPPPQQQGQTPSSMPSTNAVRPPQIQTSQPPPQPAVATQNPASQQRPQSATVGTPSDGLRRSSQSQQPQSPIPAAESPKPKAQADRAPASVSQSPAQQNGTPPPKPSQNQAEPSGTGVGALRGIINQGSGIPRGGVTIRGAARGSRGGNTNQGPNDPSQTTKLPDGPIGQPQAPRGGGLTGLPRGGSIRGRGQGRGGPPSGQVRGAGPMNPGANMNPGRFRYVEELAYLLQWRRLSRGKGE